MPPTERSTRDRLIDAFETLLVTAGSRAATLDAVAAAADVSKGGLLYHFPNKEALIGVLLDRLDEYAEADAQAMSTAPEGAAAYFIKSSVWADTPLDRAIVASTRLAEVAHEETRRRFARIQQRWLDEIAKDVGPDLAKAVLYMGDGLYFNAMLSIGPAATAAETAADVESLLSALARLRG